MRLATIILLSLILIPEYSYAATIYVPDDFPKIQDAIDASVNGDSVLVKPGTYFENIDFLGKSILVSSTNGHLFTTIDGNNMAPVVTFKNGETSDSTLTEFTIRNGNPNGIFCNNACPTITDNSIYGNVADEGAGIFCNDASPTIINNSITGNTANFNGGGIFCQNNSYPDINKNTIYGNNALYGGGIYVKDLPSPLIALNIISNNSAKWGGGIYCWNSASLITENDIKDNTAEYGAGIYCDGNSDQLIISTNSINNNISSNRGGGIHCYNSSPTIIKNQIFTNESEYGGGVLCIYSHPSIKNNTIKINLASYGGGVYCENSNPSIKNNHFLGNSALSSLINGKGGAIYCDNSHPFILNNTIYKNKSDVEGGGIYIINSYPTVINSIIWNNTPDQLNTTDATISYSDIKNGYPGTGNIDTDPLFFDPTTNDIHLSQDPCQPGINNPCVDTGDPTTPMTEGSTRTDGVPDKDIVDMGYHYIHDLVLNVPDEYPTIQDAIDKAVGESVILVAPGTYKENINYLGKNITIRSDMDGYVETFDVAPTLTLIDGNQKKEVVLIDNCLGQKTKLEGFTVTNGYSDFGGGVKCVNSTPIISNNLIKMNGVNYYGAGIGCSNNSSPIIHNNIIFNNVAFGQGGGIGSDSSNLKLINNTIYGNKAINVRGGGFWSWNSTSTIINTIFWDNDAPVGQEIVLGDSLNPSNLSIDYSNVKNGLLSVKVDPGSVLNWGSSMIDYNPLFVDSINEDFHIIRISPCINIGTNFYAPNIDFEGNIRPYMGTCDVGADEFIDEHILSADKFFVSESMGGKINIELNGGIINANRLYIILGSVTGNSPGTMMPGNLAVLPINWDGFTVFAINLSNTAFFHNFIGSLDNNGKASAVFNTLGPMPTGLVGMTLSFAYGLNMPWDFVSNPINILVIQ